MHLLPQNRRGWVRSLLNVGVAMGMISLLFGCMTSMPGRSHRGPLPALAGDEIQLRDNLKRHVTMLATTIGERNMRHYTELDRAAQYIAGAFQEIGYATRDYAYPLEGKSPRNIEAELPGSDPAAGVIVVGAHYDHLGKRGDYVFNGADDNGSGSVGVMNLARAFAANPQKPKRTVVFCLWCGEEQGLLGSRYNTMNPA